ncbi:MAG: TolC family protein [Planctomycetota bacterium]|jgi:outer membrane protein TolC
MQQRHWAIWLAAGLGLAGCSSRHYVRSADLEGMDIAAEKMAVVRNFRAHLVDPTATAPEPAPDPGSFDVPEEMTVGDALTVARLYSREYKTEEEAYFLSALDLSLTRRNELKPILSGSLGWNGSDGHAISFSESTALALTLTQKLPTGGQLTVTGSAGLATLEFAGERVQDTTTAGSISLTQALLRGAPRWVAFEGLTQSERNVIYAARRFESFRQSFAIGIADRFYGVVVQKKQQVITQRQLEASEFSYKLAKAKYRLRQGVQRDVFRAERDYRNAQNNVLEAEQTYKTALDRFKIRLGLPLGVEFDIADDIPEVVQPSISTDAAIHAALNNRLDLLTQRERLEDTRRGVRIARHSLLPDLDVNASYSVSALANTLSQIAPLDNSRTTFGINLEIPLDRKAERNAYRASLIGLAQAQRALRQSEDDIIVTIRSLVRGLRLQRQAIENDEANIETEKRNLKKANIDFQAGMASNRDLTEAIQNLANAEINILQKYADYEIARLRLFEALGVLFVDRDGRFVD